MKTLEMLAEERGIDLPKTLYRMYWNESNSLSQIADYFGVTTMTVLKRFRIYNISTRNTSEAMKLVDLKGQNNPMYGKSRTVESKKQQAEKIKSIIQERGGHWARGRKISDEEKAKRLGKFAGSKNGRWIGGKRNNEGYVEVYTPDHPFCNKHNKTVYEHRLVMECLLGRYLNDDEVVHHINFIKSDNRPSNLRLMTAEEHIKLHAELTRIKVVQKIDTFIDNWSLKYSQCRRCETVTIKHAANGLCRRCYQYLMRRNELDDWIE